MDKAEVMVVSTASKDTCSGRVSEDEDNIHRKTTSAGKLAKYLKSVKINGIEMQSMIDPGSSDCKVKATAILCNEFDVIRLPSILGGFVQ